MVEASKAKVYVVVYMVNYVPSVRVYLDREKAIQEGKDYAGTWNNEDNASGGDELYFNQEEDGSMENAVLVFEAEVVE